ncbi:hypothetical protein LDO51_00215 [Providencia alcalifaciens]|uniref:hypothetical protein n=1 Tax=Providencia alcalifaciens TaxID=126385 RepID=UPI001CE14D9F|nr:hypothetical protein [Providencia alcalifaciens]UBX49294.1 hypothetical protein LDO51_00215 [Providencia alcalifaciens]
MRLLFVLLFFSINVNAEIKTKFISDESYDLVAYGTLDESAIRLEVVGESSGTVALIKMYYMTPIGIRLGPQYYERPVCPLPFDSYVLSESERKEVIATFNEAFSSGMRMYPHTSPESYIPKSDISGVVFNSIGRPHYGNFCCNNLSSPRTVCLGTPVNGSFTDVPIEISSCHLNNQDLTFNFSSTSLNASGLNKSSSLSINCTQGAASNYTLRLTSASASNGKLDFGNGVLASISIDGKEIQANGTAIELENLTSRDFNVNAALAGTASSSGTFNTNGILVLESW